MRVPDMRHESSAGGVIPLLFAAPPGISRLRAVASCGCPASQCEVVGESGSHAPSATGASLRNSRADSVSSRDGAKDSIHKHDPRRYDHGHCHPAWARRRRTSRRAGIREAHRSSLPQEYVSIRTPLGLCFNCRCVQDDRTQFGGLQGAGVLSSANSKTAPAGGP